MELVTPLMWGGREGRGPGCPQEMPDVSQGGSEKGRGWGGDGAVSSCGSDGDAGGYRINSTEWTWLGW